MAVFLRHQVVIAVASLAPPPVALAAAVVVADNCSFQNSVEKKSAQVSMVLAKAPEKWR